ncbi:MAG: DUF3426 domain-containing protein [Cellvibrionales bacterium]|nr:DUF3426 domain-containing protein [Cellvibrionales bacterium]
MNADPPPEFTSVTRCPFCHRAFHISSSQLQAAAGQVRCGDCLRDFDAKQHFIVEQRRMFDAPTATDPQETDPPTSADDSDAPILLGDLDHGGGTPIPRSALQQNAPAPSHPSGQPPATIEPAPSPIAPANQSPPDTPRPKTAEPPPAARPAKSQNAHRARPLPEPLSESKIGHSGNHPLWRITLCLAILALPLQALHRPPDALLPQPWFQQIGQRLCPYLGCRAPLFRAPEAIHLSGSIEPHPRYQNALRVRLEMLNSAPVAQPWPAIRILFRNTAGRLSAARRFAPAEYLQDPALAAEQMPRNRRVEVEFALRDPGEQSTGYEFFMDPAAP